MKMDYKNLKGANSLKIERVFETSRLAGELMACAYENIIPINRKSLNVKKKIEPLQKFWSKNKEQRKCVMGI
jgi:hypothetical protein